MFLPEYIISCAPTTIYGTQSFFNVRLYKDLRIENSNTKFSHNGWSLSGIKAVLLAVGFFIGRGGASQCIVPVITACVATRRFFFSSFISNPILVPPKPHCFNDCAVQMGRSSKWKLILCSSLKEGVENLMYLQHARVLHTVTIILICNFNKALIYLLTYSTEQSPSWEANWFCS